jgi:hypothetical protein
MVRWITGGSSYLSSHDKRVLVGLGHVRGDTRVGAEIRWPNGSVQSLSQLTPDRYYRVVELSPSPASSSNR